MYTDELSKLKKQLNQLKSENADLKNSIAKINAQHHALDLEHRSLSKKHKKYKKLVFVQLIKPLIKFEQLLHALNAYRKGFRRLQENKGSFGKAYQTVRRTFKKYGLKATKQLLLDSLSGFYQPRLIGNKHKLNLNFDYQPKVSVIVPNYNHGKYIVERLDSIIKQSYKNIELIILDDNSTDDSVKLINEFLKNNNITYQLIVNQQNAGNVFKQWKKGIEIATGELIWICESDDTCEPDFLRNIVPYFDDHSVQIAFGRIQFINQDGLFQEGLDSYRESAELGIWNQVCIRPAYQWFNNAFGVNNVYANASGGVFRNQSLPKSIWDKACEFKICGDWFLYLHLAGSGKIVYTPDAVSYFRQHEKNTSVSNFNQLYYYKEYLKILNEISKFWSISTSARNRFLSEVEKQYKDCQMDKMVGNFNEIFTIELYETIQRDKIHIQLYFLGFHPGGGELFPIVLANQLVDLGYIVSMVALDLEQINTDMRNKLYRSIPVYHISNVVSDKDFLKNAGVDIIHSHIAGADHHLSQYLEQNQLSIPYVVTMHGSHDRSFSDYTLESTEKMIAHVSKWVYTADKNLDFFKEVGVPNTIKFPNAMPVDLKISSYTRENLSIKNTDIVFVFVARGIYEKGWIELVTAFEYLLTTNQRDDIHLILIGTGEAQEKAKEIAHHIANIHFLGYESAINSVFRFCDCLVLPSRFQGESYPLCLIQAIQEELPCIATDIGEVSSMITNDSGEKAGILIPMVDNTTEFTKSLQNALQKMCNNETRKEFQAVAQELTSRYDIQKLAEQYALLYRGVIQSQHPTILNRAN